MHEVYYGAIHRAERTARRRELYSQLTKAKEPRRSEMGRGSKHVAYKYPVGHHRRLHSVIEFMNANAQIFAARDDAVMFRFLTAAVRHCHRRHDDLGNDIHHEHNLVLATART